MPKIQWEVRDVRSLDDGHFAAAGDIAGLRESRPDGSLAFMPASQSTNSASGQLGSSGSGSSTGSDEVSHQAVYRCVASTSLGTILSRSVHVTVGK